VRVLRAGPGLLSDAEADFYELQRRHVQALNEPEALLSESHVAHLTRRVEALERALVSNFSIDVGT
jgi:hypothetical protein